MAYANVINVTCITDEEHVKIALVKIMRWWCYDYPCIIYNLNITLPHVDCHDGHRGHACSELCNNNNSHVGVEHRTASVTLTHVCNTIWDTGTACQNLRTHTAGLWNDKVTLWFTQQIIWTNKFEVGICGPVVTAEDQRSEPWGSIPHQGHGPESYAIPLNPSCCSSA